MSGRPNNKWIKTMIAKFGSREAVSAYMAKTGSTGGSRKVAKGFAIMPVWKRSAAGRLGGTNSKRRKALA
jgi:hypothetical protein